MNFRLIENKKKRPTENHSIQYKKETIVAIIPDYIGKEAGEQMVKALNKIKKLKLDW